MSDALCLIALSRNGLTQVQLLAILKLIGYEGTLEVRGSFHIINYIILRDTLFLFKDCFPVIHVSLMIIGALPIVLFRICLDLF